MHRRMYVNMCIYTLWMYNIYIYMYEILHSIGTYKITTIRKFSNFTPHFNSAENRWQCAVPPVMVVLVAGVGDELNLDRELTGVLLNYMHNKCGAHEIYLLTHTYTYIYICIYLHSYHTSRKQLK